MSEEQMHQLNNNFRKFPKRKRRLLEDPQIPVHRSSVSKPYHIPTSQMHQTNSPVPASGPKLKRSKTPKIYGSALPVNRLIETLDKESLQALLQQIVNHHPETTTTISKLSPKATLEDSVKLMKEKFQSIIDHLPYKCDIESDYSYIRVKVHLTEFLNCLSDFILTLLPPMDAGLANACDMLDVITSMIHDLPNFSNNEFQYTKSTAYEQIANSWLIVLTNQASHDDDTDSVCDDTALSSLNVEKTLEFVKTLREHDIQKKIEKHNDLSFGKFTAVLDFVKSEFESCERIHHSLNNNGRSLLSDMISVDYSNYSITARTSH
ncbi:hypothetical protein CXQ85_002101 [Candidozyma haemuli]|uniref:Tethering factor for nuclear proteasome STS1 n=1 Tax=Candidozyma haemuli TaxID=45357 RepID=A0A2V1ARF0_9ASCO|nr:hypothetical protein CXQ85_002101 [[Candida] haemuloni]PVH20314.1 hypothetical protein CXQ85_002101 [[Candida] haemuloni]